MLKDRENNFNIWQALQCKQIQIGYFDDEGWDNHTDGRDEDKTVKVVKDRRYLGTR